MKSKLIFPLTAFIFLFIMLIYFFTHPSYEKSLQAKYYYETAQYDKAYALANEAFSMDVYNRMASTIMAQSKTALKYEKYIKQAKEYMVEINKIASKTNISDADRAKIKMMSEIVVDSYTKLAPSVITDKSLVDEARKYHDNFEKLLEKVAR
jgi:tRNA U34 5-carboxymethylaminomethyl modifying enzyme MnmG/GidA